MRYGYWMPVFGGWLRNVEDENMSPTWEYNKKLAIRSEQIGFDLSLVAELNLNDIKGEEAPSLDAWSTSAALMAVTSKLELMVAVRPTFHNPALLAKGSVTAAAYGVREISERHRHRYEVNIHYRDAIEGAGLKMTGMSPDGVLPEIVEREDHPWFVGVQFHPEMKSRPFAPHPLFASFIGAARNRSRLV